MHSLETKNQFIELRAQGFSLDAISSQLDVPRATLGRWHHESVEQIQRLRALQWHLLEEQIGHRLEESLQRVAQRIRKFEDELDTRDPGRRNTIELVRIIRDSRREYLQLRSLLLAPLQPTRGRSACPTGLDPHKRDKTRQNPDSSDTTPVPINNLQQPKPAMSHSDDVAADVRRQVTSPETSTNTAPPSANAANDDPVVPLRSPLINTRLQRCEPTQPLGTPTASAVSCGFNTVAAGVSPASEPGVSPGGPTPTPKKHKPYWLNGHYYENPEYPEHIARAMFARSQP